LFACVFYLQINVSYAQCPPITVNQCGTLPVVGGGTIAPGSTAQFCIGDSIGVFNTNSGIIDSSWICWGDGTLSAFSGNFTDTVKHKYNYKPDSCVNGGQASIDYWIVAQANCVNGVSINKAQLSLILKFYPHADFYFKDSICQYEIADLWCGQDCSTAYGWANISAPDSALITWHFGDGTDTSYYTYSNWINTPQHSYTSPGNYTISMVIQQMGALPCGSDSVWHTLHVKAKSSAFPIVYANECAPDTFPGNIIMLNVDSLAWNVAPPNTVSNYLIPNPTFIVPNAGVTYIGAYLYGCWVDTNNVFISNTYYWDTVLTFRPKPDLTFIAPSPDYCDSVHFVFQNYFSLNPAPTDSGYLFTILHNGTNIFSDTSANPANYFTDTAGTYIVSALAWNDCDTLLFVDTFLITAPTVVAVSNDTSLCRWDASIGLVGNPGAGTWSLNGIVVSNTFNPSTATQPYNYLVYDLGGCSIPDSLLITVNGLFVKADNDTSICDYASGFLLNAFPGGGIWQGQAVDPLGNYNPQNGNQAIDTNVYVYNDTSGCVITDTVFVTINSLNSASVTIPDSGCVNTALNFTVNNAGLNVVWNYGDLSALDTAHNATHNYTSSGNFTVTLFSSDNNNCKDTITQNIFIDNPPNAVFTAAPLNGCAILPVIVNNTSINTYLPNYVWYYDNTIDTIFKPDTLFFGNGPNDTTQYPIQLVATNICTSDTFTVTVSVYSLPHANFGANFTDTCSPALVQFNNISIGNTFSYSWYVNGLFYSSDSIPPPYYMVADSTDSIYQVMLVAENICGKDSILKDIIIHPNQVKAFFNTSLSYGCAPLTVNFSSSVQANSTIQWNFGDNTFATGDTVSHTYLTADTFVVWQRVDNYCGLDSTSHTIITFQQPPVSFTVDPVLCGNLPVQFYNTSVGTLGAIWDFGDASNIDSINSAPSHLYSAPGVYNVTLIGISTGNACRDTFSIPINVLDYPTAVYAINPKDGCEPLQVSFADSSLKGKYFKYDLGNGDSLTGPVNPQNYTYYFPGDFTVTLTSIDANGCMDDTSFSYVKVYPKPVVDFTYMQVPLCSTPANLQFTNQSTIATSFLWNFGGLGTSNHQDDSVLVNGDTTFAVTLIGSTVYGCTDTITKNVVSHIKPTAKFTALPLEGCPPLEVDFLNQSQHYDQSWWTFGDGYSDITDSPTHIYDTTGFYNVQLIVANDSVCYDTLLINNYIEVYPLPNANFSYVISPVGSLIPGNTVIFTDSSILASAWNWTFGDGNGDAIENPTHQYDAGGNYIATLFITSDDGCTDTISKLIELGVFPTLYVPNSFTPNNDGKNEMFEIKGSDILESNIIIYNRWGQPVFTSDNAIKNYWNGSDEFDRPSPPGVYIYLLSVTKAGGDKYSLRGKLNLIK